MKTRFILVVCLICLSSCKLSFLEQLSQKIQGSKPEKASSSSPTEDRRVLPRRPDHHKPTRTPVKKAIKITVISILTALAVAALIIFVFKKYGKSEKKAKKSKKSKKLIKKSKKTVKAVKKAKKAVWSMPEEDVKEEKVFVEHEEPIEAIEPDFKVVEKREVEHPQIESSEPIFVPKAFALVDDSDEENYPEEIEPCFSVERPAEDSNTCVVRYPKIQEYDPSPEVLPPYNSDEEDEEEDDRRRKIAEIETYVAEKEMIMAMKYPNMEEITAPKVSKSEVKTFVNDYPSMEEYEPHKLKNPFN